MNLTDTGPLVAIADKNDPDHFRCVSATKTLPKSPLLTTWPCFTEAMYLLHRQGGYWAQAMLWQFRRTGNLVVHELTVAEADRMDVLMKQYRDTPIELADAFLAAIAESQHISRIFTIDQHFRACRFHISGVFNLVS